jgi:hypothetical protein
MRPLLSVDALEIQIRDNGFHSEAYLKIKQRFRAELHRELFILKENFEIRVFP